MPPSGPEKPALQVQIVPPAGELEPAKQPRHVDNPEAPTTVEYVPGSHALHSAGPVDSLYLPATHAVQLPPSGPEYPALQVQIVLPAGELEPAKQPRHVDNPEALTTVEYVPGSHALHSAGPVDSLYLPATHAVQLPPSGPE